jgi:hypothetical protein
MPSPGGYNTGVDFRTLKGWFNTLTEPDNRLDFQLRLGGSQSRFSANVLYFKQKINYDKNHFGWEAPSFTGIGATLNFREWQHTGKIKIFASLTVAVGGVLGGPRFDVDYNSPNPNYDPNDPKHVGGGEYNHYGEVYHHGGYVGKSVHYYYVGAAITAIGKVTASLPKGFTIFVALSANDFQMSQQATSIGTMPRRNIPFGQAFYGIGYTFK